MATKKELIQRIQEKMALQTQLVKELEFHYWLKENGIDAGKVNGVAEFDNGHGRYVGTQITAKRIVSFKLLDGSCVNFDRATIPFSSNTIFNRKG